MPKSLSQGKNLNIEFCERHGSTLKSKYDEMDIKFIYENNVLKSNDSKHVTYYAEATYKQFFWTGIKVSIGEIQ